MGSGLLGSLGDGTPGITASSRLTLQRTRIYSVVLLFGGETSMESRDEVFSGRAEAVMDFHRARRRAALQATLARLRGNSSRLLSYEEVRQRLRANSRVELGIQDVPIDHIVGSVGRYTDFSRGFLPLQASDEARWVRVKLAAESLEGLPPIEVYKIGDVYFVRDGNHRVSVARASGFPTIHAYVTEVKSDVALKPDDSPDDLILKYEYAEFLDWSNLRQVLPGVDLMVTVPGGCENLKEHINVHRYFMGLEQRRDIGLEEAVVDWHRTVYQPLIQAMSAANILHDFPDRTQTDLYLWISEHRSRLEASLGWTIDPEDAAQSLAKQFSPRIKYVLARVSRRILDTLIPEELSPSPPPGEWREKRLARSDVECTIVFQDVLVTINGRAEGWQTLEDALEIARREGGRVLGLHILTDRQNSDSGAVRELEAEFVRRCRSAGVPGKLAFGSGPVAREIASRAQWADLAVVALNYPPAVSPIAKLKSGFRTLILRSPIPVLATPVPVFPLERALLAYDGSPRGREALFLATYLATRWRGLSLTVLTVQRDRRDVESHIEDARRYLTASGVDASYVTSQSSKVGRSILTAAADNACDLIVMGGYGRNALFEVFLGSAVNDVLRKREYPVLICP